jgi:transcriptional regulator GlxA family with amidase domain
VNRCTNEAYLADAIHEATGETVSTYLSNLRLQYSLTLLNESPHLTFDAIAIDSGHGSYSSFFRLFTKKYGISPSEYRKLAAMK